MLKLSNMKNIDFKDYKGIEVSTVVRYNNDRGGEDTVEVIYSEEEESDIEEIHSEFIKFYSVYLIDAVGESTCVADTCYSEVALALTEALADRYFKGKIMKKNPLF